MLKEIVTYPQSALPKFLLSPVAQTLDLTSIRVLYWKVTFANKFSSSLKIFVVKRNKIQQGSDNIYPEKINVCQDNVKRGKSCTQMSDFISYAISLF